MVDSTFFVNSINFSKNCFLVASSDTVFIYDSSLIPVGQIINSFISNAQHAHKDEENNVWIADAQNGLLKFVDLKYQERFVR